MVYIEQVYASSARTCDYYDGRIMPIISITELTELLNYFLAARFIPQVVLEQVPDHPMRGDDRLHRIQ